MPNFLFSNMLTRIFLRNFIRFQYNFFGNICRRNLINDNKGSGATGLLPGGGLEKLQGGIKEEKYFNEHDLDLMAKIREEGSKFKCEDCVGNWPEYEKSLSVASQEANALRETCSASKHKNCLEEAFFMTEQQDSIKILQDKLRLDNESQSSKISQVTVGKEFLNSDDDKQNPPRE